MRYWRHIWLDMEIGGQILVQRLVYAGALGLYRQY